MAAPFQPHPELRRLATEFAFLGMDIDAQRLIDGQGKAGRVIPKGGYALIVLDRWRECFQPNQVHLVVPRHARAEELWQWINDAAGVWPVPPIVIRRRAPAASATAAAVSPHQPPRERVDPDLWAVAIGDRESRTCWNSWCSGFGQLTRQVLIRRRQSYRLWQCDNCKALNPDGNA